MVDRSNHKKRVLVILAASFCWVVLVCVWFFLHGDSLSLPATAFSHPVVVVIFVVSITALIWMPLRKTVRRSNLAWMLFKLCSDILLIVLIAGLFLWNWPPKVYVLLGSLLGVSYVLRVINAVISLMARKESKHTG